MADNRLLDLAGGAGPKGPPPAPPGPPKGAAPPQGGDKLPETPKEAVQVLDSFGITPDEFPLVQAAVEIMSEAMHTDDENEPDAKDGPPDVAAPRPRPGGPPPA